ncbi:Glycosyl transferase family protein [Devosia sp. LC5]|uniref:glycosyltransferase family 2 protein n=1 Tax=Devosia sp. LC5 TaxID=1502724 RepID=UPI0004E318D1|nr:glycosyltransferase family A protein [Devosia sp. LC5]KFC67375.1 Glycosyl transferase family protein [Devosia sp. LC5]
MVEPRVTAIIIVYNGDRYLAEAIDSVVAQSFPDWELIIADDGSSDRGLEIARDYADRHPTRIRSIAHPDRANHGMSATRNLGIAAARAPLIGFLDCDDIWLPHKLAEQVALLDRHPDAQMIYGRTLIWHSWRTGQAADDFFYDLGTAPDRIVVPPGLLTILLENRSQTPTTCNALMRSTFLRDLGGFESRFRGMFEDQVFFAKALLEAPAYISSRNWAHYRQHKESFSAKSAGSGGDARAHLAFLLWFAGYVVRRAPAQLNVLAQIARLGAQTCWAMIKPRRPSWLRAR